jgi:hypothetical protein
VTVRGTYHAEWNLKYPVTKYRFKNLVKQGAFGRVVYHSKALTVVDKRLVLIWYRNEGWRLDKPLNSSEMFAIDREIDMLLPIPPNTAYWSVGEIMEEFNYPRGQIVKAIEHGKLGESLVEGVFIMPRASVRAWARWKGDVAWR